MFDGICDFDGSMPTTMRVTTWKGIGVGRFERTTRSRAEPESAIALTSRLVLRVRLSSSRSGGGDRIDASGTCRRIHDSGCGCKTGIQCACTGYFSLEVAWSE